MPSSHVEDLLLLNRYTDQLDDVLKCLKELEGEAQWAKLGYFDSSHHEQIERLFFRFMALRRALTSIALQHDIAATMDEDEEKVAVNIAIATLDESLAHSSDDTDNQHITPTLDSFAAVLALFVYDASFVRIFEQDRIAVSKLNENFYRSDISANTFGELQLEATDDGRVKSLEHAYLLYIEKYHDETVSRNPQLAETINNLVNRAHDLIKKESLLLPSLNNQLRHAKVAEISRHIKEGRINVLKEIRAHTFKGVSRIKSPSAHLIKFSSEQKKDVLERLEPGDMIFTYTAGYISDVFIPGAMKHSLTYIGHPEQRVKAGLTADSLAKRYDDLPEGEATRLLEQFSQATVDSLPGEDAPPAADVIEAVAEGVIMNNLCRLMDTHVNRLLVLRPLISPDERANALMTTFRFLGDRYDFGFNFADTSAVVCTEVLYHAFNMKGKLDFELTKRAGHPTLSADDIVNYYLANNESFDFVLLALEYEKSACHDAKVYYGNEGKDRLIGLMKKESK